MQENNSQNANLIVERLKALLNINTDVQLARLLNVRPNTLSTWKQRNSIDYKLTIELAHSHGLDLNELFFEDRTKGDKSTMKSFTPLITKENILQYINNDLNSNLEKLPYFNFILGETSRNIAFQVPSNNLAPLIPEESFAICDISSAEQIKKNHYYVLISRKYGFFLSKIKLLDQNRQLELNDIKKAGTTKNYTIKLDDISEIWKVIGISTYNPFPS